MNTYVVYWIHYPDHQDPYLQGYIGITSNIDRRLNEHKSTNPHMRNRMNKGAIYEILHSDLSLEEACNVEFIYRPSESVGWNVAVGGGIPPPRKGKKNKVVRGGDTCTPAQKQSYVRHSEFMKGSLPPNSMEVNIFGQVFPSISRACLNLNITYEQYLYYVDHPHFNNSIDLVEAIKQNKKQLISKSRISSNKVKRGVYYVTDPNGMEHVVSNGIVNWCSIRGVNPSNLRRGKSKGFVCRYEINK